MAASTDARVQKMKAAGLDDWAVQYRAWEADLMSTAGMNCNSNVNAQLAAGKAKIVEMSAETKDSQLEKQLDDLIADVGRREQDTFPNDVDLWKGLMPVVVP